MLLSILSPVLLVLLPGHFGEAPHERRTAAWIIALQARLGEAIRVLRIDEATHPAVVLSFGRPTLPTCVLVRQGVELWRLQGLPTDESFIATLLALATRGKETVNNQRSPPAREQV